MPVDHGEGELQQKEIRWIYQGFLILHGASMVAAYGFVAETWGRLPLSLLQSVVITGWVHFTGVLYALFMIHRMEEKIKAGSGPLKYHFRMLLIPALLLLAGWATVGYALTKAALWEAPEFYYNAGKASGPIE